MLRTLAVAAAACLVLLVGCSGGDGSATDGPPATNPLATAEPSDAATSAVTTSSPPISGEVGSAERFVNEIRARTGPDGVAWEIAFRQFRDLAATTPLDADTAKAAGELIDDVYIPINGAIRFGAPEMEDLYLRTREAALAARNPATPEMVLALDAVLAEWEPYLD
jgi:hypothetical protein